ncbi:MAG: hypothetical protein WA131_08530 [Desulfitobacteriaceae bacterium]
MKQDNQNGGMFIPVGGPNGMVQLLNGTIQNQSLDDLTSYNQFMGNQVTVVPDTSQENEDVSKTLVLDWLVLGAALVLVSLHILHRVVTKRKSV